QIMTTVAPCVANAAAVAFPIPELAPVTRQTFPRISDCPNVLLLYDPHVIPFGRDQREGAIHVQHHFAYAMNSCAKCRMASRRVAAWGNLSRSSCTPTAS